MALSFSLYVVMTRSLRSEGTRTNLFYTALGVFVLLSPLMPGVWIAPPLHDLAVMTGVGLLGWLGLWALDRLAAAAPVSVAAPLACLQLPFALALAGAWHGVRVPSAALAGLVLIAGVACFLLARPPRLTVLEPV